MIYMHYDVNRESTEEIPLSENIDTAFEYCRQHLKDIDFNSYDEIVFLSKSIGTIIAADYEQSIKCDKIFQIFITPLDETLPLIEDRDLIICGDRDQFLPGAKTKLAPYPNTYIFPGFSHSLESKTNYRLSIKTINDVSSIVDLYLKTCEL